MLIVIMHVSPSIDDSPIADSPKVASRDCDLTYSS